MAIALVNNNRGTATAVAGSFDEPIDLPAGASITLGNTLILTAAYDNSGTLGVDPNMFVTASAAVGAPIGVDLRGNIWTRLSKGVNTSAGAADDSIITDAWICYVQNPYTNGDDITVQFSFPVSNVVLRIAEFSGIKPVSYPVVGPGFFAHGDAATTATAPAINPTVIGQLVIGTAGLEGAAVVTGDADVTGGTWITMTDNTVGTIRAYAQYKIISSTVAQNWAVTWTGAQDWVAQVFVLDVFVPAAADFVPGDPDYPCVAGFEGLPTETTTVPIDTGTAYLLRHEIFPNSNGTQDFVVNYHFKSAQETSAHTVVADLYVKGNELPQDEITTVILPVRAATGTSTSPSGNVLANVNEPGGTPVTMTNGDTLELWFDPTQLTAMYTNYRVLRFGLRYLAWKDDSSPAIPGEGFEASWRDDLSNNGSGVDNIHGAWLTPNYQRDVQYETRWFGEVNTYPRGNGIITTTNLFQRACFTVNDLSHMASGDNTTSIILTGKAGDDPLQTNVYFDYVELVVELAPERRLGQGARFVSNSYAAGVVFPFTPNVGSNEYGSRMFTALNTNTYVAVSSANEYVVAIREGLPPSPSDYYRARTASFQQVAAAEAIGPSLQLYAFTQPRETLDPQPELTQVPVSGGVFAGAANEYNQYYLGAAIYDRTQVSLTGAFVLGYQGLATPNLIQVYAAVTQAQYVKVDGATQFDKIKVLVRPDDLTTASLTISVQQPYLTPIATATISVATALLAEDVGNGWREVSVNLSVPVTPTASGTVALVFSSASATALAPWSVAAAAPIGNLGKFGYNIQSETTPFNYADYAAVLQCSLAVPDQALSTISADFTDTGPCASSVMSIPRITISNGALYDFLAIERSIDGGTTWEPVTLLSDPVNGEVFDDIGVPWDIAAIQYRSTGYRDSDRRVVVSVVDAWASTATAPGAAFGLIDYTTGELYAYVPVDESELEITWNPLNPISRVELHGIDYSVALRSPEERGLQVTVVVAVSNFTNCTVPSEDEDDADDYLPEIVTPGQQSMTPKPFDGVRSLEQRPRLQLNLPGGHTRAVSLDLGTMSIKTIHGLYLSEITLTDVVLPEVNPYD